MRLCTWLRARSVFLGFLCFSPLAAQDKALSGDVASLDAIAAPENIIGHELGDVHSFYWEMEKYIQTVANVSDRVQVKSYGQTYEGRELYTIIISSPENLGKLEEYRRMNLRLTDPQNLSPDELADIAARLPAIVWLGYNIHGDEASGMEAAMAVLHRLSAGNSPEILTVLEKVICIIDPCQNPDGHERFVQYVRSRVTLTSHPHPDDYEHDAPWPGGRTNHYLFDLNRDFFLKIQRESIQRATAYHEWWPHVFVDFHESFPDAHYFFSPPSPPYSEYMEPEMTKWWNIMAHANAQALDKLGQPYFTREIFDAFYPGYATSFTPLKGSVGMTFEQPAPLGVSISRNDGSLLTLKEAIRHHLETSMATLQVSASRREEKIRDFHGFFVRGLQDAGKGSIQEIILAPKNDPALSDRLVANLLQEKVKIFKAGKPFSNPGATSYLTKKSGPLTFPEGTYIIPLRQPQNTLIKTLLAPDVPVDEDFLREERRRKQANEPSQFYDITAWSMPLTYGIDAYWTEVPSTCSAKPVIKITPALGGIINGPTGLAYLIPYNTLNSTKLLIRLQAEGLRVRLSSRAFRIDGRDWEKGTLIVGLDRNPQNVHEKIKALAEEMGVQVTAARDGLCEEGVDLGSPHIVNLIPPKIAVLVGPPTNPSSCGTIHYLLEREFGLSFISLSAKKVTRLADHTVLVLPHGYYEGVISSEQVEELKRWLLQGGTVVAISGATDWLRRAGISKTEVLNDQPDPADPGKKVAVDQIPGAIVRVNLDPDSFLSYGLPSSVAALAWSQSAFEGTRTDIYLPLKGAAKNTPGRFASQDELRLSGFIWPETERQLAGKAFAFVERIGLGKLIMFTHDPLLRGSYYGLVKIFINGLMLAPSMDRPLSGEQGRVESE